MCTEITLQDLKNEGFSVEILNALDCLTRRNGESYEDFITRCKCDPDVDVEEAANTQNTETKIPKTGVNDSMVGIIYLLLAAGALVGSYKLKKFYFEKTNF